MKKNKDFAIKVCDVSKTFKLKYDRHSTLKEKIVFWKNNKTEFHTVLNNVNLEIKKGETIALIGTNGSGKSNITEAIRWVMGEGSAKSLRGENMKDVIFAGSQMRAPMNHAEVELIFDNRDHQLASDDDEVVVTRKILRNGESDYLLNHHPVRLKDVKTQLAGSRSD